MTTSIDLDDYLCDATSHPGEVLGELMIERMLTIQDVHQRTGIPPRIIRKLLREKRPVGHREADALAEAFGVPAALWLRLQEGHDKERRLKLIREQVAGTDREWRLALLVAVPVLAGLAVMGIASMVRE